jgi:hypothetical protein
LAILSIILVKLEMLLLSKILEITYNLESTTLYKMVMAVPLYKNGCDSFNLYNVVVVVLLCAEMVTD